jgi:hypothetical protein
MLVSRRMILKDFKDARSKGVFLKSFPAADVFANVWPIAVIAAFTLSLYDLVFPPSPGVGGRRKEEQEQPVGLLICKYFKHPFITRHTKEQL